MVRKIIFLFLLVKVCEPDYIRSCIRNIKEQSGSSAKRVEVISIYLQDKCLGNSNHSTLAGLCPNENWSSNRTQPPVTSPESYNTYTDEHCAKCRRLTVDDYIGLGVDFFCFYVVNSRGIHMTKCLMLNLNIPVDNTGLTFCEQDPIMRICRDFYPHYNNALIDQMCLNFLDELVIVENQLTATEMSAGLSELVLAKEKWQSQKKSPPASELRDDSRKLLEQEIEITNIPSCENGKIYDIFQKLCRDVKCGGRRTYTSNQCTRDYVNDTTIWYNMRYELRPRNLTEISSIIKVVQLYYERVWNILKKIDNIDVTIWHVEVVGNTDEGSIKTDMRITVDQQVFITRNTSNINLNTDLDEIEELLYSTFNDNFVLYENNDARKSYNMFNVKNIHTKVYRDARDRGVVILSNTISCPYVTYRSRNISITNDSLISKINNIHISIPTSSYEIGENLDIKLCVHELETLNHGIQNGTLVIAQNTKNNKTTYWIESVNTMNTTENTPTERRKINKNDFIQARLTEVCLSLSIISLFITFVTYCLFYELRTGPGYNTMILVGHLFISQLLFVALSERWPGESDELCVFSGVVIHYSWLCTFTWMSVCAFHMHATFTNIRPPKLTRYRLLCYISAGDGIPVLIVLACIIYHISTEPYNSIGYGGKICYIRQNRNVMLVFVVAPLALMVLVNSVLFTRTVYHIQKISANSILHKSERKHLCVYFKLSVLLGLTWSLAFVLYISESDSVVVPVNYLFIVLNGCQGVFIFVAYCCNKRIWRNYHNLITRIIKK